VGADQAESLRPPGNQVEVTADPATTTQKNYACRWARHSGRLAQGVRIARGLNHHFSTHSSQFSTFPARVQDAVDAARSRYFQALGGPCDRHYLGAGHLRELRSQ
jgi:hypothetical protein